MTTPRTVRIIRHLLISWTPLNEESPDAAENFAQEVIVALFDKVVPNGLGSVSPNWNSIFHQYATVQSKLGDILIPGGTCNRKFADE
jgi:hypothetical protein